MAIRVSGANHQTWPILGTLMFLMSMIAVPSQAHEQRVAITQILFNPNSGNIEIAHRIYLHDAEHAVQDFWGSADLMAEPEDLEKLALYVRGNFSLALDGKPVQSQPVGVEIDEPYVWIYDELPIPKKTVKTLTISDYILRDVWPDQANLVNVEIGNFRKSAFFASGDEDKVIEIFVSVDE